MIKDKVIEEILEKVSIVKTISNYVTLKKKGYRHKACCPFHNEDTPSFMVDDSKGIFKCFGCGKGGDVITFIREKEGYTFTEAVRKLAAENGIYMDEREETAEECNKRLHRESLFILNEHAAKFFEACLKQAVNSEAWNYVESRWGIEFASSIGIGFAPDTWDSLKLELEKQGFNLDKAIELGLLKKNETGRIYDAYRNRIVIPIKDKMKRIIGFTARKLSGDANVPKYINSPVSEVYSKKGSLFGIDTALRDAASKNKVYLMEGAPDALRLKLLGINNAVAALGTGYGEEHYNLLKPYTKNLVFIPDADELKGDEPIGTGIKAVLEAGEAAIKCGMNVSVIPLPLDDEGHKQDADSYIVNREIWSTLKEEDFILFLAHHLFKTANTSYEVSDAISKLVHIVYSIKDELKQSVYIEELMKLHKAPKVWKKAIDDYRKEMRAASIADHNKKEGLDLYGTYGFAIDNNKYYNYSEKGSVYIWSNFTLEPLFHIKDYTSPKRLYRITNTSHTEDIIELKQEDLVSLNKFKQRVEGLGNYIWLATEKELTKLKMYLYEQTETALEVKQMGQQKEGFYAFGNGVYFNEWVPADDYGICRLQIGNFYLPSASRIYASDKGMFQFERKFILTNYTTMTICDYGKRIIDCFGHNGIVGLAFYCASCFKDIIVSHTKFFPILNLFGPKGSGKSELGHSLMSFFIIKNTAPNLMNSTIAALSDTIAQCANALVHIDEYKNTIEISKREFLKGLWDGTGRNRMNMDNDKKRQITAVDCGVILSGQEMPTIDIALFSRLIFLSFKKSDFSIDEKRKFDDLTRVRDLGFSHITMQLQDCRKAMEVNFVNNYRQVTDELANTLNGQKVEDRILRNWAIVVATIRAIENLIPLPFQSTELFNIAADGIIKQNKECLSNNELSQFWSTYAYLAAEGEISIEGDYRIDYESTIKTDIIKEALKYKEPIPILAIRKDRIYVLYNKACKAQGIQGLSTESLDFYLKNSAEYFGIKPSMRFKNILKGQEVYRTEKTATGGIRTNKTSSVQQALLFDYNMIKKNFGINLEVVVEQ